MLQVEDASVNNRYFLVHLLHAEVWTHCAFLETVVMKGRFDRRQDLLKRYFKGEGQCSLVHDWDGRVTNYPFELCCMLILLPKFSLTEVETTQKSRLSIKRYKLSNGIFLWKYLLLQDKCMSKCDNHGHKVSFTSNSCCFSKRWVFSIKYTFTQKVRRKPTWRLCSF